MFQTYHRDTQIHVLKHNLLDMGEILRETVSALEKEESSEEAQAQLDIWKYIFGFVEPAVVKCAIELGIAEAIENNGGPMTFSELSSTLGCDPSLLNRIMRFLTHRNIFKAIPTSTSTNHGYSYAQTPLSRRLMRNDKHSMAAFILLETSPVMLAPWHSLSACVLANGNTSFEKAHGQDVWKYAAENLDHSNLINDAMACHANLTVPAIIEDYSEVFDGINSLVDVGGGNGTAMSIVAKACSWIRAINFDLQHVIDKAPEIERVEHVAGDMFVQVPKADAAFIMAVLHDWGDEECIQILKKCREAIPKENGRVIIAEVVIEEGGNKERLKDTRLMLDMVMMAHTNLGKERTLKEWDHVIKMAGFSTYTVKSIKNIVNYVIMAFP
ncbi:PREDICTED: 3'-hydroxy-N-methyl-(S)-coclaurine 4'-O-methyltransferase 2-like [Lupinus angustifolius]|nr:PREDICTED: 3'-hydroxy-N-methyl-(S)-coclaurine 4'-O-methyltransferase 2-like [Lupinus angustifolius]